MSCSPSLLPSLSTVPNPSRPSKRASNSMSPRIAISHHLSPQREGLWRRTCVVTVISKEDAVLYLHFSVSAFSQTAESKYRQRWDC
jgi:hypothetical protein